MTSHWIGALRRGSCPRLGAVRSPHPLPHLASLAPLVPRRGSWASAARAQPARRCHPRTRAQALEAGPVPFETLQHSLFDGPDLTGEFVDEIAVVADEKQCALERLENSFQLLASEKIEVIGGFVQYQEVCV